MIYTIELQDIEIFADNESDALKQAETLIKTQPMLTVCPMHVSYVTCSCGNELDIEETDCCSECL